MNESTQADAELPENYSALVGLLREFSENRPFERTEANEHFFRLWLRKLDLCNTLALLARHDDALGAQIILRSQLELFIRLRYFVLNPQDAWIAERANELEQWFMTQNHYQAYPNLTYSVNPQTLIEKKRCKWAEITFRHDKNKRRETPTGTMSMRAMVKAIAKIESAANESAESQAMSAYGLYQFLCGETHSGMLNVAAQYGLGGNSSANPTQCVGKCLSALKTSAWFMNILAEPFLDAPSAQPNTELVARIRRMLGALVPH